MEIINILLTGRDMAFCKALSESISQLSKEIMITVTDRENREQLERDHFLLFLVEGEKVPEPEKRTRDSVFLVENKSEALKDAKNKIFNLYKYENVKEMIQEIYLAFNLITGKSIVAIQKDGCRIISIFSIFGGSGKTAVSMGLGQEFARFRGKKTLYINFEEWDGPGDQLDVGNHHDCHSIGDYLYYINKERETELYAFLNQDEYGVFFFHPTEGRNQLKGLNAEELGDFIKQLTDTSRFDYILFDCHNCLDDTTLWLLDNSFQIVYLVENIPLTENSALGSRDEQVIAYMGNKLNCNLGGKIIKVLNGIRDGDDNWRDKEVIIIDWDPASFRVSKGIKKINIERGFGQGIKAVADRIEND